MGLNGEHNSGCIQTAINTFLYDTLGLQSRFGDNPLRFQVICHQADFRFFNAWYFFYDIFCRYMFCARRGHILTFVW